MAFSPISLYITSVKWKTCGRKKGTKIALFKSEQCVKILLHKSKKSRRNGLPKNNVKKLSDFFKKYCKGIYWCVKIALIQNCTCAKQKTGYWRFCFGEA